MRLILLKCLLLLLLLMGCQLNAAHFIRQPPALAQADTSTVSDAHGEAVPGGVIEKVLLKTQTSWDGGDFAYPSGQAKVSAYKFTIPANKVLNFHCHPVPPFIYILKGTVEVEKQNGEHITFTEGSAFVELMTSVHRSRTIGGEVEMLVFYAGSTTLPNSIKVGEGKTHESCS